MENFLGKDGFRWWVGVIETRVDPLGMGRCQVRIFGWHDSNQQKLPTKDLPWASALHPINNADTFSSPRIGDWVMGFFMDGDAAQFPIMMGVLPGIKRGAASRPASGAVASTGADLFPSNLGGTTSGGSSADADIQGGENFYGESIYTNSTELDNSELIGDIDNTDLMGGNNG
jgi:hypothetical protein